MATIGIAQTLPLSNGQVATNGSLAGNRVPVPLKRSGILDSTFKFEDSTPAIGREYPSANIVDDILKASNADELLRDLAITSMFRIR